MKGMEQTTLTGGGDVDTVTLPVYAQAVRDLGSTEILDLNGCMGPGRGAGEVNALADVIYPFLAPVYVKIVSSGSNAQVAVRLGQYTTELNARGKYWIIGTAERTDVLPFFSSSFAKSAIGPSVLLRPSANFGGVRLNFGGASTPSSVDLLDVSGNVIASGASSATGAAPSHSFLTLRNYITDDDRTYSAQYPIYH
jgi:hypothetical protein